MLYAVPRTPSCVNPHIQHVHTLHTWNARTRKVYSLLDLRQLICTPTPSSHPARPQLMHTLHVRMIASLGGTPASCTSALPAGDFQRTFNGRSCMSGFVTLVGDFDFVTVHWAFSRLIPC